MTLFKFFGGLFLVLVVLVLGALLTLCFTGLALGAANAWVLEAPFVDAWSAVWDRWLVALLWSWLFLGGTALSFRSS